MRSVTHDGVHFPSHARKKWHSRVEGAVPCTIMAAWSQSFDVEIASVDGTPRMHPETETLLVHHPDENGYYDRVVKTVLNAREDDLERHCERCEGCGTYIEPGSWKNRCRSCQLSI